MIGLVVNREVDQFAHLRDRASRVFCRLIGAGLSVSEASEHWEYNAARLAYLRQAVTQPGYEWLRSELGRRVGHG